MDRALKAVCFTVLGYLCGSVLFARVFCRIFGREDCFLESEDKNPGTSNVFKYGGFYCGLLTLIFDILKGFLPVFTYTLVSGVPLKGNWLLVPVMAAPVMGGVFPVFFRFSGGKSLAAAAGSVLGLLPYYPPAVITVCFLLLFSTVLRVSPDSYRTVISTACALAVMLIFALPPNITAGYAVILIFVYYKLFTSEEKTERMKIKLLWMH